MNGNAFHFERIELHRVLGIERGWGWVMEDLSEGVNVIHGPNGSGKTTTARVVQELLWPGRTGLHRPTVLGCFRLGAQRWRVEVDAGDAVHLCEGMRADAPSLGPPEHRLRYWLALADLIQNENDDAAFAKAIADASQGGFDLDAAASNLGYREKPKLRTAERRALEEALARVNEARSRQQQIEHEAVTLEQRRAEHGKALAAEANRLMLEKAKSHAEAQAKCAELRTRLDELPEAVAKLHGNEREVLDQLTSRSEHYRVKLRDADNRRREAEATIGEVELVEQGVGAESLRRLRAEARRLGGMETELHRKSQELVEARAHLERARRRLGEHPKEGGEDRARNLETVELPDVSELAREFAGVCARERVIEERRRRLSDDEPENLKGISEDRLREGLSALANWLATPAPPAAAEKWVVWLAFAASGAVVALAIFLAVLHHWAWLLAGGVGAALAAMVAMAGMAGMAGRGRRGAREANHAPANTDERQVHRRSFERAELPDLESWEAGTVARYVHQLVGMLTQKRWAVEQAELRRQLEYECEAHEKERAKLHQRRDELAGRLGLTLTLEEHWLPLLVSNLQSWQQHSATAAAVTASLEQLEAEYRELLAAISGSLAGYGYADVSDADTASQAIEDLAGRQQRLEVARREHAAAEREMRDAQERLDQIDGERCELLESLGLTRQQETVLDEWLGLREHFGELEDELRRTEAVRDRLAGELKEHPHLLELTPEAIDQRIERETEVAGDRDELTRQITTIENDIARAKQGHELSDALAERDRAVAQLAEAREENRCSVIGALLTDWVTREAVQRSRPEVFRRADDLLVRVTRGMLQLEVDESEGTPAFFARFGDGPLRSIAELSLGERVQMLVSVRMAFMEQDEPAQLPLILDEILGTTDDTRAAAVIDTALQCAREGRQVFCFTAQHDEAGKWISRLEASDVPYRVIDLAHLRGRHVAAMRPLELADVEQPQPPAPEGLNWQEYGELLGVPAMDPMRDSVDDLHLWHVVHDPQTLHRLLCQGIEKWGQLRVLMDRHGGSLLAEVGGQLKGCEAAAAAIDALCRAWRIGRGRPVDRATLQDAGCVSEIFLDDVTQLANELGGEAEALLDALEDSGRRPARWLRRNTDKLREYLIEHGHISEETPLDAEALYAYALAPVAEEVAQGRLNTEWLRALVYSLPSMSLAQPASETTG